MARLRLLQLAPRAPFHPAGAGRSPKGPPPSPAPGWAALPEPPSWRSAHFACAQAGRGGSYPGPAGGGRIAVARARRSHAPAPARAAAGSGGPVREPQPRGLQGWASWLASRASFVLTHGSLLYLFGFLLNDPLGMGWPTIDPPVGASLAAGAGPGGLDWGALSLDAAAFGLWAAQHSGMARDRFKAAVWGPAWRTHPLERPVYALVSVVLLLGMCRLWAPPFPGAPPPSLADVAPWRWAVAVPLILSAGGTILGFFWTLPDHIFGTERYSGVARAPQVLYKWPYSMVRHPANASVLWLLGGVALLGSPNHAAYAAFWATYVAGGTVLEEAGCHEEFGPTYGEYQRRVGAFWPRAAWWRQAASGQP